MPQDLGALGLVIGVCALRALRGDGCPGRAPKWPNDLNVGDRKLGGVLIEMRAEAAGPACVVIGIGLNVAMGEDAGRTISATGIDATDLARAGVTVARNALVAALVTACIEGLVEFERAGLKPFLEEWRQADALGAARHRDGRGAHRPGAGARDRCAWGADGGDPRGCAALRLRRCHREAGMMSVLLIDIGNTRIKWARAGATGPGPARAAVHARWTQAHYAQLLWPRGDGACSWQVSQRRG